MRSFALFSAPAIALLVLTGSSSTAMAQLGFVGAQSTLIEPSIRFTGMGRTGTAVFWGSELSDWANPAVLGYDAGLRFERSKTQLVPDLADDVFFTSNRIVMGRWGVGLAIAGRPMDWIGGNVLDYGVSIATDVDGNTLGSFGTTEECRTIAVGVSAAEAIHNLALALGNRFPTINRFADVSLGQAWKHVEYREEGSISFNGSGEVDEKDHGLLVRATPYNAIDFSGLLPAIDSVLRTRLDVSYGAAELNYDESSLMTFSKGSPLPVVEDKRHGTAFHLEVALPKSVEENWRGQHRGWLYDLTAPLFSYGTTKDRSRRYLQGVEAGSEVRYSGWELTFANLFSYRKGHIDDPTTTIIGDTSGWGLGIHFLDVASFQYDHASVPQSIYLGRVKRNGFALALDPVKVVQRLR